MKTASMENTKDAPVKPRERAAGGPLEWWGPRPSFLAEVRAELAPRDLAVARRGDRHDRGWCS